MRSLINSFIPNKRMSPPSPKSWGRAVVIPASKTDLPEFLVNLFLLLLLFFWCVFCRFDLLGAVHEPNLILIGGRPKLFGPAELIQT